MSVLSISLFVATPAYDGKITCRHAGMLLRTVSSLQAKGIESRVVWLEQCALLPRARNNLVAQFMASDSTHMLMVDSDIVWPDGAVERLLAYDLPFVATAGRRKTDDMELCVRALDPDTGDLIYDRATGLLRVGAVGTGFILLKREVFEAMERAYQNLKLVDDEMPPEIQRHLYGFFLMMHDERRKTVFSEDYSMCFRWTAIGGEIWVDPEIQLQHIGAKIFGKPIMESIKFFDSASESESEAA